MSMNQDLYIGWRKASASRVPGYVYTLTNWFFHFTLVSKNLVAVGNILRFDSGIIDNKAFVHQFKIW